jgi:hypothetical protein
MTMSRRKFLKRTGSGVAIVVVGGTVLRAFSKGVFSSGHGPAYEPWKDWKTELEGAGTLSLVASAILAALVTVDASGSPWAVLAKTLPPISEKEFDNSQLQLAKDTYVETAAAFGTIAVHDVFDNIQRLQGGMLYQRMHLGYIKWTCYAAYESND